MHTYEGSKSIFNYNTDLSGDVVITDALLHEVTIPGEDLIDFVAYCYVLQKKIEKLEQTDSIELLC